MKKIKDSGYKIIIFALTLAVIGMGIVALVFQQKFNKAIAQNQTLEQQLPAPTKPNNIPNQKQINSEMHLYTPSAGARLCTGQSVDLKWQVPAGISTVQLTLNVGGDGNYTDIGTFPSSYGGLKNSGSGHYKWTVPDVQPGAAYEITLSGTYTNPLVNTAVYTSSPGPFTINNCLDSSVPKY